jgi:hypothetical protein
MWLKILSGILTVAKYTGLDKKVKGWIKKKLDRAENRAWYKAQNKYREITDKVDAIKEKYDLNDEEPDEA